ncbi:MAG: hypothetical protein DCO96_01425 [Fluviicola sp. XM-24bin1]|nr:MAG: hypothetical protein DCO96_01425 [Fluviicola sp. XM-24bin1]
MKIKHLLILFSAALLWTACSETSPEKIVKKTKNEKTPEEKGEADDGRGGEYADYMAIVDADDSWYIGNTMYYTKNPDVSQETYQVYLLLDSASNVVRIEERYTRENGGSVLGNFHYYKDGIRIASKEIYNEGQGESELFYERVSYYEDEKPIISKIRSNKYEEYLENEVYEIITPVACPTDKAERAIAREGEFQTNFLGVIKSGGLNYIEVGEGDPNGFSTTLLVQQITPLVGDMISNPSEYKGKPVSVDFREMPDGQGFTFQALLAIAMVVD